MEKDEKKIDGKAKDARLRKFMKRIRKPFRSLRVKTAVGGAFAAAIGGFAVPKLYQHAASLIETGQASKENIPAVALAVLCLVGPKIAERAMKVFEMHNSRLLADDVRTAAETGMTDDVIDGSPDFYRNRNSGEMAAKVGKGGSLAVGVTDILHSSIVPNLCGVVASIGYMCYYVSPALASAITAITGFRCYNTYKKYKAMRDFWKQEADKNSEISGQIHDVAGKNQALSACGVQEQEKARLKEMQADALEIRRKTSRMVTGLQLFNLGMDSSTTTFIAAAGVWQALLGGSLANFMGLFSAGQYMDMSMTNLGYFYNMYVAESDKLADILHDMPAESDKLRDPPDARPLANPGGEIRFEGVRFAYNGRLIYDGLDLTIAPGEKIAVVGPSGAGKTTLAKLLLRLVKPASGRITIGGQDIAGATEESLRDSMMVSLQTEDQLAIFDRSIADNVRFRQRDMTNDEVREALDAVGLSKAVESKDEGLDANCGKLSGGEKQRVVLARAMAARGPSIVVLDEPTSALDAGNKIDCMNEVFRRFRDCTMLIITHDREIAQAADRVVVVEDGKVAAQGNLARAERTEAYRRVTAAGKRIKRPYRRTYPER